MQWVAYVGSLPTQGRTSCSSLRLLFILLTPSSLNFLGLAEDPGLVQQSDSHSHSFLPKTHVVNTHPGWNCEEARSITQLSLVLGISLSLSLLSYGHGKDVEREVAKSLTPETILAFPQGWHLGIPPGILWGKHFGIDRKGRGNWKELW